VFFSENFAENRRVEQKDLKIFRFIIKLFLHLHNGYYNT